MLPFYENKPDLTYAEAVQNMTFPPHLHVLAEMLYVREGEIMVTVDGKSELLRQGGLAVVFPNLVHCYESARPSRAVMLLAPPSVLGRAARQIKDKKPTCAFLPADALPAGIAEGFGELAGRGRGLVLDALAQLVFVRALELLELEPVESCGDPDLVGRAIVWMSGSYRGSIQLGDAAAYLGVSKCYLSRILGGALGMGFSHYLNCLRVDYAKNLLRSTRLSVLEIAMDSGYENLRTFNRAFKSITGQTPMEHRRQ